ncbi:MAG: hypothetical protein Q4C64_04735 [Erysipelotrichia bacterium]|nr:hypothetical protein [Erysipelotrichia bacterium]
MIKRSIFYVFIITLISVGLYFSFQHFQPKIQKSNTSLTSINDNISYMNLTDFNEYLKNNAEKNINVIFYQEDDINSQFLFNNILPQIYENYEISSLDNVIFVSLEETDYKEKTAFSSTYGFSNVPALINLKYKDGNIIISSILCDTDNLLINYNSVEDWLQLNEIIPSPEE